MFPQLAQQMAMNPKIGELILQHILKLTGMRDIYPLLNMSSPTAGQPMPGQPMGAPQNPIVALLQSMQGGGQPPMGGPPQLMAPQPELPQ
jgi:hypothetical protein